MNALPINRNNVDGIRRPHSLVQRGGQVLQTASKIARIAPVGKALKSGASFASSPGAVRLVTGQSKAIDTLTRKASSSAINVASQKTAVALQRRIPHLTVPGKVMHGPGFYLIVAAAFTKDLLDIGFNFTLLLSIATILTTLLITFIVTTYLIYNGVGLTEKKLAWWVVSLCVGLIPFLNFIPEYTISLFVIRLLENNRLLKQFVKTKEALGKDINAKNFIKEARSILHF